MARPKSAKQYQYEHLLRANQYSGRLTRIYDSYVAEFTKLAETLDIDPKKVFSFADYPEALERCNKTLEKVVRDVEIFFDRATREEWAESNLKNDELVDYLFEKTGIPKERLKTFYNRNAEALRGFQTRVENGFTISDRIWKITDQYKGEIELGIDLALGEGKSAAQLSRDVRQYLKEPNNLFRRVRDKHGNLVLSQRAKAFHPGQGVYRSSYKNAMRLARTEVNMAYREADAARWDELPFVVGYEVHLSGRHPEPDICDDLKGKYPKDFKFRGWHPHCFCYCTTILSTDEEFDEMQRRILDGEDVSNMHSENEVTDVPEGMKDWISDNADRAKSWSSVPNFIKDNFVEGDLSKGLELDLTPPEPEKPKGKTKFKTEEEKEEIRRQWAERRAVYHYGENILRYMDGISDIDTSTLADLLKKGDVKAVLNEARALAAKGKEILKLSYLENPMQVARDFSAAEAKAVNEAVGNKIAGWESAGKYSTLADKQKKLKFEVEWLDNNHKYPTWKVAQDAYKKQLSIVETEIKTEEAKAEISKIVKYAKGSNADTIKILADELKTLSGEAKFDLNTIQTKISKANKEIDRLEKIRIEKEQIVASVENALQLKTSSKIFLGLKDDWEKLLADPRTTNAELKAKAEEIQKRYKKLVGDRKPTKADFSDDAYSKKRKDAALWAKETDEADRIVRDRCGEVWRSASELERDAAYGYTAGSSYINEPLRGQRYQPYDSATTAKAAKSQSHIQALTEMIERSSYDRDIWLQRGVDYRGAQGLLGVNLYGADPKSLIGKTVTEKAFSSCGIAKGKGFNKEVIYNIYCPKGTKMLYCEPFSAFGNGAGRAWDGLAKQTYFGHESEMLLQQGTVFRIVKAEYTGGRWFIDLEVIAQNPVK
jgi:hypothetical protein